MPSLRADLDLGGVQAELDALGLGAGEHIRQCPKTQARTVGDCAPPLGQQGAYFSDGPGDGGAVDTGQQPEDSVRKVMPQMNECGYQPVDEVQLVAGPGSRGPLPGTTPSSMATAFDSGLPRHGQLPDRTGQMMPRVPREQPMSENRPIDHDRHSRIMPPASNDTTPAITHQLVTTRLARLALVDGTGSVAEVVAEVDSEHRGAPRRRR